jgi:hypothetical protein
MFKLFGEKPDHPMFDVEEARKLLADLPQVDPFKALAEITDWLASVKDASGFSPELRLDIIMLLDETGQPLQTELLRQYLGSPHLQDFHGLHLWQGIHGFMKALAEAYSMAISNYQQAEKKSWDIREKMPVICVRLLRTVAEQMKLELMRYIEVEQSVWDRLCGCYSFAEANQCADSMVHAYSGHVIHTSPQRELLRALMLYMSSPETLAADQIEVSYRIAGRLVSFFDFKLSSEPDCADFIDLSLPSAPIRMHSDLETMPTMRFFGATRAIPAIEKIISQNERDADAPERRFGNEFTPAGKLTVLKHLRMYWQKDQPHRHQERKGINSAIEVVHGFRVVSQLVTRIDLDRVVNLSEKDATALKERSGINLVAGEDVNYSTEVWPVSDVSIDGVGAMLLRETGSWVKIGDLCGLRAQNSKLWWVGMIRRIHTDPNGMVHVGVEVLAKKPMSVWLRTLGKGAERVSSWETSSGSFDYDYLPAILLPDVYNSFMNATMLMESGYYVTDSIYQVMMGEKSRDIKLTSLLAEGEDYERVSFQWLSPAHT